MGALEDHHCEPTLFQFIFGLAAMKSRVWKGCFLITMIVGEGWSVDEERWIMDMYM